MVNISVYLFFFFLNDTPTPEISPLPLHDALPIWPPSPNDREPKPGPQGAGPPTAARHRRPLVTPIRLPPPPTAPAAGPGRTAPAPPRSSRDRKSTRLNSSHSQISYAVFCLKKKKE